MGEFPCFSSPPAFGLKRQLFDAMADQSPKPRRSVATAPQKATDPLESADCVTDSNQSLLEECLKKAREWEKHCDVNAPEGMEVILLKVLVETVIRLGNPSIIAMCNVRKLLCKNCLEFNATRGQCEGKVLQPMDRCLLLREGNA